MSFRMIFLASAALLMGACGGNDEDIEQGVDSTAASSEYATEAGGGSDEIMDPEADTSRSVEGDAIPQPETEVNVETPETDVEVETTTDAPGTGSSDTESTPPETTPEQ